MPLPAGSEGGSCSTHTLISQRVFLAVVLGLSCQARKQTCAATELWFWWVFFLPSFLPPPCGGTPISHQVKTLQHTAHLWGWKRGSLEEEEGVKMISHFLRLKWTGYACACCRVALKVPPCLLTRDTWIHLCAGMGCGMRLWLWSLLPKKHQTFSFLGPVSSHPLEIYRVCSQVRGWTAVGAALALLPFKMSWSNSVSVGMELSQYW